MIRMLSLVTALCLAASLACAATFTANGGVGTSTIGTGGDYASLAAAAADFNGAQAVTGNYTFYVLNDLSEPANVGFGKATNGFTVTLKPAASATVPVTITFTATTDNAGPTGNLVIGDNNLADWTLVKTDGFVIDGAQAVGGTSRDMIIQNTGVTFSYSRVVVCVGDSDDVTIKNCQIFNVATGGTNPAALSVGVRDTLYPDRTIVRNNLLQAIHRNVGHGIDMARSGTVPLPGAVPADWQIIENDIRACCRGIYLQAGIDGTIADNFIETGVQDILSVSSLLTFGIYAVDSRRAPNLTLEMHRNVFLAHSNNTAAGNYGVKVFYGCSAIGAGAVCNITNNMVRINYTGAVATPVSIIGFHGYGAVTYNMHHNSVYIPDGTATGQAVWVEASQTGCHGIGANRANLGTIAEVFNNIVHVEEPGGGCFARQGTSGTWTSNYNDMSYAAGANAGYWNTTDQATLGAWQTASSNDANSFSVNPLTTTGSAWTPGATADLHFMPTSSKPLEMVGVNALPAVTNDVDGEARNTGAGQVYPGADCIPAQPLPVGISGFSID